MLTAGEFCNRDVVIATPEERIPEIARRMRDEHVGCVVVVEDSANGRVAQGIVTDRDIVVGLVAASTAELERAQVRDMLSGTLYTVREGADLYEVMTIMRGRGIRRVPVVDDDGLLQGLISFDALLDHFAMELTRLSLVLERERDLERRHGTPRSQAAGPHSPKV